MGPLFKALIKQLYQYNPAVIAKYNYLFSLSPKDLKKHLNKCEEKIKEMALKY